MGQGAQQAGSNTALRGTCIPEQGQATASVGHGGSEELPVAGPVWVPFPCLRLGPRVLPELWRSVLQRLGSYQKLPSGKKSRTKAVILSTHTFLLCSSGRVVQNCRVVSEDTEAFPAPLLKLPFTLL